MQTYTQKKINFNEVQNTEQKAFSLQDIMNNTRMQLMRKDSIQKNDPYIKIHFLPPQAQKIAGESGTLIQVPNSSNGIQEPKINVWGVDSPQFKHSQSLIESIHHNQIYDDRDKSSELDFSCKDCLKISEKQFMKKEESYESQEETKVEVKSDIKSIQIKNNNTKNVWKKSWLQVIYYASKMKKIAKQIRLFHHTLMLQPFQIRMINDKSSNQDIIYSYDKYKYIHLLKFDILKTILSKEKYKWFIKKVSIQIGKFLEFKIKFAKYFEYIFQILFQYVPLYHNLSRFYIFWETVIFIACSINFIYLPFEYSFLEERNQIFSFHLSILTPMILGLDIFIKFNTKSYEQGSLLDQHIQIAKNYISSSFLVDLASLIFLNTQIFGFQATYFLFFLRFFRSTRILEIFREQFLLNLKISGLISLIFLFSVALYYGHLFACTWNAVGLYQAKYNEGWLVFYQETHKSVWQRYTDSLYFSIVTMTTIGYGDITAQSNIEKILMIFFTFVSCGVFGYTINSIGNILYDFKLKRDKYLQELAKINQYFKQYDVSLTLQGSARRYIKYLYSDERQDQFCSISLISNLSEHLKVEIKKDIFTKRLKLIQLFRENFKEEFLIQLSLKMQENIYSSDQIILNSSIEVEPCIRIINSGTVLKYAQYDANSQIKHIQSIQRQFILSNKQFQIINHEQKLEQGKHFGMTEFFLDERNSEFSYKSVEITSILSLSLSDFLQIAKQYNDQLEIFQYLRDQVKFQKSYHKIFTFCPSCKQKDHTLKECQYIFYEGKKSTIIQNYLKSQKEYVDQFQRLKRFRFHSLTSKKFVNKKAEQFQQDHINELTEFDNSLDYDDEDDYFDDEDEENNNHEEQENHIISSQLIPKKRTEVEFKSQEKIQDDSSNYINSAQQAYITASSFTGNGILINRRKKNQFEKYNSSEDYLNQQLNSNLQEQLESQEPSSRCLNIQSSIASGQDGLNKGNELNHNIINNNNMNIFAKLHMSLVNRLKDLRNSMQIMNQQITQINSTTARQNQRQSTVKLKNIGEKRQTFAAVSIVLDPRKKNQSSTFLNTNLNNEDNQVQLNNMLLQNFEKFEKFEIYYPNDNYDLIIEKLYKISNPKSNIDSCKRQNEFIKFNKKKKRHF